MVPRLSLVSTQGPNGLSLFGAIRAGFRKFWSFVVVVTQSTDIGHKIYAESLVHQYRSNKNVWGCHWNQWTVHLGRLARLHPQTIWMLRVITRGMGAISLSPTRSTSPTQFGLNANNSVEAVTQSTANWFGCSIKASGIDWWLRGRFSWREVTWNEY